MSVSYTSDNLILGAGLAGLGAAYTLRQRGHASVVLEKDATYGGLAGNFTINGFRFDRFVHFSFTKDERVNAIFRQGSPQVIRHIPNPFNLYHGKWLKHPAQNNLFPLSREEKALIIADFKKRPDREGLVPTDYEQWLRCQYGDTFAERFPMTYTRKYWMTEARDLETSWVGSRLYQPSIEEVENGARTADTPVTYYAKEMRYPASGGFKQYLAALAQGADIRYNAEVVEINLEDKVVRLKTGEGIGFQRLISSLPLPTIIKMLGTQVPRQVSEAAARLRCTCGWQISIGLKTQRIPPYLWWYIYDEDILPARIYSPSLKSADNVPEGCSSLQLEVYCERDAYTRDELIEKSITPLLQLGIISEDDILFTDLRFEPWANVIFDHNIQSSRSRVRSWLHEVGIETIGRFGCWDYLWSDQTLLTGLNIKMHFEV